MAMVLRYLPKFSSTSLEALLVEESIQKKRQKKPIFIYGTTFRKMEEIFSESKFYCSQKQKKNYGRHTGVRGCGVGVAKEMSVVLARQIASHRSA